MDSLINSLVPGNTKGKPTDIEHSKTLTNREEALDIFKRACKKMLHVNDWHKLTGFGSGEFLLTDGQGNKISGAAAVGNYFKIDIPGPGPSSGGGYDWVQVEAVEDKTNPGAEEESLGMRVRSSGNPHKTGIETAHFFTSEATSTFIIHRQHYTVYASYHGRNEVLNADAKKLKDSIRNTVMGAGAMVGMSELQWARLIKSFLEKED